ncbi:phospho-N-acetylmuramoyl-pentapeptide-transferase [Allobranchiibius sp. CTAmp26]|uniref:phospho-N-acetylmuramoyl-pentapeptide- transferase n=1 Tax=Allobranchiibius sp. CTAmp26 TaxID=2815214 RepID=UPI001AA0F4C8|nr:phospho-N-acetylmuramoyl-pentapeptide-transferase [Allobranchiibius sp. CTAmp26]MBO1753903.1 phospho-N-acetylmuramoyl-pentapeptide-transferase [Allobranchiibius sp. CTAmp26]
MKLILIGALVALAASLVGTRYFISLARRHGWGQFVRDDGPTSHHTKRGTPQMGGIVIITGSVGGYALAHLLTWAAPTVSGLLVLFLMVGIGFVGFLDDWTKISRERSLGLRSVEKLAGQTVVAVVFAILATRFARGGITPASYRISFVRDTWFDLAVHGTVIGVVLFVLWANLMIAGTSNGVNLTDGLDGQASGACAMVFGAYVLISVWQFNQNCRFVSSTKCYDVRDPLDLAVVAACVMGACFGFLWWNASPAQIFMGDTGSLGLGAALAGLAIMTRTELLMIVLGGLFVFETVTVILQVGYFKATKRTNGGVGKRLFKMTPIHHSFEMVGWEQVTVTIRFWIICGLCVAAGLGLFYAEWVVV